MQLNLKVTLPLLLLIQAPLWSSTIFACESDLTPCIDQSTAAHTLKFESVFTDEFDRPGLMDTESWLYERMEHAEHRSGYNKDVLPHFQVEIDENGEVRDGLQGRRFSAFYDKYNEYTAFTFDDGIENYLVQTGLITYSESDTLKNYAYEDPDSEFFMFPHGQKEWVNFGAFKLYTSFLTTFSYDPKNGRIPINEEFRWGPGHFFEVNVNFSEMKMGGHRHSFWLMPAIIENGIVPPTSNLSSKSYAYDREPANGVEIDVFEYERYPEHSKNTLYMKVLGDVAGNTDNRICMPTKGVNYKDVDETRTKVEILPEFKTGQISEGWHKIGLLWTEERLVWFVDGVPVVEDELRVPKGEDTKHYMLITREMNSGVMGEDKKQDLEHVIFDNPRRPADPGLAGQNVGLRANRRALQQFDSNREEGKEDFANYRFSDRERGWVTQFDQTKDHVKTDYVRVWKVSGDYDVPDMDDMPGAKCDYYVGTPSEGLEIDGLTLSWDGTDWYQVQNADGSINICEGGTSCTVPEAGEYIVINHTTGKRDEGLVLPQQKSETRIDSGLDFKLTENTFEFPSDSWYQVQSAIDYSDVCNGEIACAVETGLYNIINHSSDPVLRLDDVLVNPNNPEEIVVFGDSNIITWPKYTWPDHVWFQVQRYGSLLSNPETVFECEGKRYCELPPGDYRVINLRKEETYEVNIGALGVSTASNGMFIDNNDATEQQLQSISKLAIETSQAKDFFKLLAAMNSVASPQAQPTINFDPSCGTIEENTIAVNQSELSYSVNFDQCALDGAIIRSGVYSYSSNSITGETIVKLNKIEADLQGKTIRFDNAVYESQAAEDKLEALDLIASLYIDEYEVSSNSAEPSFSLHSLSLHISESQNDMAGGNQEIHSRLRFKSIDDAPVNYLAKTIEPFSINGIGVNQNLVHGRLLLDNSRAEQLDINLSVNSSVQVNAVYESASGEYLTLSPFVLDSELTYVLP